MLCGGGVGLLLKVEAGVVVETLVRCEAVGPRHARQLHDGDRALDRRQAAWICVEPLHVAGFGGCDSGPYTKLIG